MTYDWDRLIGYLQTSHGYPLAVLHTATRDHLSSLYTMVTKSPDTHRRRRRRSAHGHAFDADADRQRTFRFVQDRAPTHPAPATLAAATSAHLVREIHAALDYHIAHPTPVSSDGGVLCAMQPDEPAAVKVLCLRELEAPKCVAHQRHRRRKKVVRLAPTTVRCTAATRVECDSVFPAPPQDHCQETLLQALGPVKVDDDALPAPHVAPDELPPPPPPPVVADVHGVAFAAPSATSSAVDDIAPSVAGSVAGSARSIAGNVVIGPPSGTGSVGGGARSIAGSVVIGVPSVAGSVVGGTPSVPGSLRSVAGTAVVGTPSVAGSVAGGDPSVAAGGAEVSFAGTIGAASPNAAFQSPTPSIAGSPLEQDAAQEASVKLAAAASVAAASMASVAAQSVRSEDGRTASAVASSIHSAAASAHTAAASAHDAAASALAADEGLAPGTPPVSSPPDSPKQESTQLAAADLSVADLDDHDYAAPISLPPSIYHPRGSNNYPTRPPTPPPPPQLRSSRHGGGYAPSAFREPIFHGEVVPVALDGSCGFNSLQIVLSHCPAINYRGTASDLRRLLADRLPRYWDSFFRNPVYRNQISALQPYEELESSRERILNPNVWLGDTLGVFELVVVASEFNVTFAIVSQKGTPEHGGRIDRHSRHSHGYLGITPETDYASLSAPAWPGRVRAPIITEIVPDQTHQNPRIHRNLPACFLLFKDDHYEQVSLSSLLAPSWRPSWLSIFSRR
jgi:hypothetical protein